ncbi:MAG TPA: c-type cytochrome domain-containing protein, partial [Armatimonadota bacterium]|nr:c-type cytochrome domain-containing protein [Armatimonadota bacterium]
MRFSTIFAGGLAAAWCGVAALAASAVPKSPPLTPARTLKKPAVRPPTPTSPEPAASPEELAFFEREVRPVLARSCYSCHGPKVRQAGLRLDFRPALLKGGERGPAVAPGAPERSLLLQAVHHEGLKMPPDRKLPAHEIAALEKWIRMGAPWPLQRMKAEGGRMNGSGARSAPSPSQHWSFLPVKRPALPAVKNRAWVRTPVDAFILAKLEQKGLKPAPPADRRTLIRRATFDLIGLPPTPE